MSGDQLIVPPQHLADTAYVRKIAGRAVHGRSKSIQRGTLLTWRKTKGFPEPLPTRYVGGELWDVRQVRKWLRERPVREED
jgi:hypothetical protein